MDELNVKQGDTVMVVTKYAGRRLRKVEKITPSGLIKVDGTLYNKDGRERGADAWSANHINAVTEEEIKLFEQEIYASNVLKKLQKLERLTYEQALAIESIVK